MAELLPPTPAEGPDPYGNPDPEWLGIDWSNHLRAIDVGGARVNYAELGPADGPGLLLVHGLAGCWQNWLEQVPHFARSRRVVALDLPGFGHSPMPPWEPTVPAYGALVHDFCERIGLDRVAIAGNSLGGFVAAEAVIGEPARFEALVLVAAAGISSRDGRPGSAALAGRMAVAIGPLLVGAQERSMRRPKLRRSVFRTVYHRPSELRRELLYEQYTNGSGRPGFIPALTALVGYDLSERVAGLDPRTLIVAGRNDLIVPPQDALEWARLLPHAQTVIFDGTGHCPQLERPVRFNRLLEAFLSP